MEFKETEAMKDIRKLARDFAEKKLLPTVKERDENEIFDREIFNQMGKLGLMGIPYAEKYNGCGLDFINFAIACEEISRIDPSTGIGFEVHTSLCSWPINTYGTEEQKKKYLSKLTTGEWLGAFGLTEPNAGTDALNGATTAVKQGDEYVLNGTKIFNTNGGEAEVEIIFATTDKTQKSKGMSAFIVEKGTPGLSFGKKEIKMGIRASVQREVILQDVHVPAANLLGKEGEGFKIAMQTLDGGRVGVAAQSLGIAEGAFEHAVKYSKERVQFGRPISKQQAISFRLADMKLKIEAARWLVYKAAYDMSNNIPYSVSAAMAKKFASDIAMEVTTDAVQIFGGYGFTREYPVERYMRDAKITQIYEGTNEVQQMVISGSILR
ncbi:MAG: acyl-CoA dehydrogenase [Megasphaera sp.]|jgi:alkylation response protein AidB-like acyl-CoA dehydrogenase|uniref:acyl-CoA dehydrogenase n=1 Tax=Megasphaera sueciensis TaxID=349094 RepID=UPI003CFD6403|nr:acyl-CoA dehydrogenase [Megasphaera sp.]